MQAYTELAFGLNNCNGLVDRYKVYIYKMIKLNHWNIKASFSKFVSSVEQLDLIILYM